MIARTFFLSPKRQTLIRATRIGTFLGKKILSNTKITLGNMQALTKQRLHVSGYRSKKFSQIRARSTIHLPVVPIEANRAKSFNSALTAINRLINTSRPRTPKSVCYTCVSHVDANQFDDFAPSLASPHAQHARREQSHARSVNRERESGRRSLEFAADVTVTRTRVKSASRALKCK